MLPETVGNSSILHPLYSKQKEGVAKMRTSLLACSDDPVTSTRALQNITVLRVYHQISRIIRYLEMMDKIEDKLYTSINNKLESLDDSSTSSWMILLNIQEKLQKNMIESHKLLQPYLNLEEFSIQSLMPVSTNSPIESGTASVIPKSTRDNIRNSAQQVLSLLNQVDPPVYTEEEDSID